MALDFKALKAKLQKTAGSGRDSVLWKPPAGESSIRIVPYEKNPSNPLTELSFYYNVNGNKTYLSPSSFGRRDPILEAGQALIAQGGLSKEEYKMVKQRFFPQLRTYIPIIDRAKPEDGVRFWAFGKTVNDALLALLADEEEYGDITDVKEGRDIKVEYIPQEESKTNYAQTSIRVAGKPTALGTPAEIEKWLHNQPDLMSVFSEPSYDELVVVRDTMLGATTTSSLEDEEDDVTESPTAAKAKTPKIEATDVNAQFDTLFNSKKNKD